MCFCILRRKRKNASRVRCSLVLRDDAARARQFTTLLAWARRRRCSRAASSHERMRLRAAVTWCQRWTTRVASSSSIRSVVAASASRVCFRRLTCSLKVSQPRAVRCSSARSALSCRCRRARRLRRSRCTADCPRDTFSAAWNLRVRSRVSCSHAQRSQHRKRFFLASLAATKDPVSARWRSRRHFAKHLRRALDAAAARARPSHCSMARSRSVSWHHQAKHMRVVFVPTRRNITMSMSRSWRFSVAALCSASKAVVRTRRCTRSRWKRSACSRWRRASARNAFQATMTLCVMPLEQNKAA
mmetsp:Transcript_8562/g.24762  ORF Transcript_8562/g.24762 Transcript_8562/m.24762 type:complete len:301 (-) Transcript_8562:2134-3036(-)